MNCIYGLFKQTWSEQTHLFYVVPHHWTRPEEQMRTFYLRSDWTQVWLFIVIYFIYKLQRTTCILRSPLAFCQMFRLNTWHCCEETYFAVYLSKLGQCLFCLQHRTHRSSWCYILSPSEGDWAELSEEQTCLASVHCARSVHAPTGQQLQLCLTAASISALSTHHWWLLRGQRMKEVTVDGWSSRQIKFCWG